MQIVDPLVSRTKFDEAIEGFSRVERGQRARGISLLKAEFPDAYLQFAAPQLTPSPILLAVAFNFENFDLQPISVRFVHPFTLQPLALMQQIPTQLIRAIPNALGNREAACLIQQDPGGLPFLCLPGVREYHQHPAHTGDNWLLHRDKGGEGTLGFLLDKIYEFGIAPVSGYQLNVLTTAVMLNIDLNRAPL